MTETPATGPAQQERVHTENLRDYSRLRRSTTDRKVAGVAGGLGRHLNIDPTILRVAFVVLAFFGGAGLLLYAAAWALVPEDGEERAAIETSPGTRNGVLLVVAVIAALLLLGDSWGGWGGFPWPLILIGIAVLAYLALKEKPVTTTSHVAPPPAWVAPAGPAGGPPPPPKPTKQGPRLFWPTVALVAIAIGVLGMVDAYDGGVADAAYPALALTVVGTMLVVGAWFGRAGGLILLGIIASLALAGASLASPGFDGDRRVDTTPQSAAEVRDRYFVPAGGIHLDLSEVEDLDGLDGRTIELEANAGELVVTLPDGLDADVTADIRVGGEAMVPGQSEDGGNVYLERSIDSDPSTDDPRIDLELDLLVGRIEVRQ